MTKILPHRNFFNNRILTTKSNTDFNNITDVKLKSVCEIKYGKDHKKLADGSVPSYGSGGLMRYVDRSIHDKKSVLIPRKGTLSNLFLVEPPFWTVDTLFWTDIDTKKSILIFCIISFVPWILPAEM